MNTQKTDDGALLMPADLLADLIEQWEKRAQTADRKSRFIQSERPSWVMSEERTKLNYARNRNRMETAPRNRRVCGGAVRSNANPHSFKVTL
ncbi:hypothetical protein OAG71_01045 [bacterium]|nr:hypothetical protein [bacterium]